MFDLGGQLVPDFSTDLLIDSLPPNLGDLPDNILSLIFAITVTTQDFLNMFNEGGRSCLVSRSFFAESRRCICYFILFCLFDIRIYDYLSLKSLIIIIFLFRSVLGTIFGSFESINSFKEHLLIPLTSSPIFFGLS